MICGRRLGIRIADDGAGVGGCNPGTVGPNNKYSGKSLMELFHIFLGIGLVLREPFLCSSTGIALSPVP